MFVRRYFCLIKMVINQLRNWYLLVPAGLILILFIACSKDNINQFPAEKILVRVVDRIITVEDFHRRAEYVPRPDYCRGSNYIHKKIILNSLIAEKLLALDAGKQNGLQDNQFFKAFIQGRREQAMRQWYYYDLAHSKVKLDTLHLNAKFKTAGLTYKAAYFTLRDSSLAAMVWDSLQSGSDFDSIYFALSGADTLAIREIDWKAGDDPLINEALFNEPLIRCTVVKPLQMGEGQTLFIKILGWTDIKVITGEEIKQRWEAVKEREKLQEADRTYAQLVGKLMRVKEILFDSETFPILAEWAGERYLRPRTDKEAALSQALWNPEVDPISKEKNLTPLEPDFSNRTLFTLDGRPWTVGEFKSLVQSHPLVYRKRQMGRSEFAEQFKLAIVDLIRDHFINLDAYDRSYDQIPAVKLNESTWFDHNIAIDQRQRILEKLSYTGNFNKEHLAVIDQYLNPYLDSLQMVYSDQIEINTEQFEKLKLSSIDMFVTQQNVPYPILVPDFPILTTDNRLDYGNILVP